MSAQDATSARAFHPQWWGCRRAGPLSDGPGQTHSVEDVPFAPMHIIQQAHTAGCKGNAMASPNGLLRVFMLVVPVLMSACSANHKSIFRHQAVGEGASITTTDAKQRAVLSNGEKGAAHRFCAEPSPDVFAVIAQSLSVGGTFGQQADPKAIEAALNAAFSTSEQAATIPRTQTINMLRELMFRTCERYLNSGITSLELPLQAIRDQRLMVSILAIEQLTGAVSAKAVALGAMAEAGAGASTAGGMAVLDKARTELKAKVTALEEAQAAYKLKVKTKVGGADKELEACVALDAAKTDADKQALPQEVKDKAGECGRLKTALDKAEAEHRDAKAYFDRQSKLADAGGVPVTAGTSLLTPTALGGIDKAGGGSIVDVSAVVHNIVKMTFDQDEFALLCMKVLDPVKSKDDARLADSLGGQCLTYVTKKIDAAGNKAELSSSMAALAKADAQLQRARLEVEAANLQAASNEQFEAFWKTISTADNSSIDPSRLQAVKRKSASLLRWPTCFADTSTKDDARSCFMSLVQFRRQDLLKAATQP